MTARRKASPGLKAAPSVPEVDVAIVGAGNAGLACAIAAADAGFSVLLVGPSPSAGDGRTIALFDGSWKMLERWGVAQRLAGAVAPLAVMRLVDDTGSLFRQPPVEFKAAEIGLAEFGWNVETIALIEALSAAAGERPAIRRVTGSVATLERRDGGVDLVGPEGVIAHAHVVVGADGRNSMVRRWAGITTREWSYPQAALTTILAHARDHREASTEFHTRAGPCTFVPLPGRRSSVVWMTTPEEGQRLMRLSDAELAGAIEKRCGSYLGPMRIEGPRGLVPMGGLSVSAFSGDGVAIVGEAAHVFPPIGAQGLNLGLRDVEDLVSALEDARERGEDPGSPAALSRYDQNRRGDVAGRTNAVDLLNRTLLADFLPADFLRGAGLLALSAIGPLRRLVMRKGVGPQMSALG